MTVRSATGLVRASRGNGFTLIEVLVTLVLLALVLALVSGGLRFARGTWEATARLDEEAGHDIAENFLQARLSEALPLYEQGTAGTVRVAFQGHSESLRFVAPTPNGPAGAGLYRFVLEVARGYGPGQALVVRLAPYQSEQGRPGVDTPPEAHVLVGNVRSLSLRYFGRGALRAQPAWHTAWSRSDVLPDLIELTIARDGREDPSPLTIELKLRPRAQ
jgi:prepilin-type N-terminal cleavage/methylation domain-containing protein